jgi:hypothetical protein
MSDQSPEQPQPKKKRKWWRTIAGLALLLLVAWCASHQYEKPVAEKSAEKSTQKAKERTPANTTAPSEKPVNEAEKSTQKSQEDTAANTTAPSEKPVNEAEKLTQRGEEDTAANTTTPVPTPNQASPQLGSEKNDVVTRMSQVWDRDYYHETGTVLSRQNSLPASEQARVDDKLTAEEVFAAREVNPSVPGPWIIMPTGKPRPNEGGRLSLSEGFRYRGLIRIHKMAVITLFNNRCSDRRLDGNQAAAATIIESIFGKLPREVQDRALDHEVKLIEEHYDGLGGWQGFCDRMNRDIKGGYADV